MGLESAIQHLKESLADPTHKWECEECKQEHEQLLEWLEDYKRLQSVSSWISCSERMPERDGFYLAYYTFTDGRHAYDIVYFNVESPISSSISHWMPLPEKPKEVEE